MFVLDSSDQMPFDVFESAKEYIRSIVGRLDVGMSTTRVGMVSLAGTGQVDFYLGPDYNKQRLMDNIWRMQHYNVPADVAANLRFVRETMFDFSNFARPRIPKIVVMFIADATNISYSDIVFEASRLKQDLSVSGIVNTKFTTLCKYLNLSKKLQDGIIRIEKYNRFIILRDKPIGV